MVFWMRPHPPIDWHPNFSVNKRYWGGTSWPSFIHIWFLVPEFSKFKCFESSRKFDFGVLLGSSLVITLPKCALSFHGGSSQNAFAGVTDNTILLIYFSVEALRYNLEIPSYMSTAATKTWLKWNKWGSNKVICLTVMQELKCAQMIVIDPKWA